MDIVVHGKLFESIASIFKCSINSLEFWVHMVILRLQNTIMQGRI